jgi:hypothetical protein
LGIPTGRLEGKSFVDLVIEEDVTRPMLPGDITVIKPLN